MTLEGDRGEMPDEHDLGVAIVGMAGRFPGADSIEAFWEDLKRGRDVITRFGEDRAGGEGGRRYVDAGYVLRDIAGFDASFFEMTPREAAITDPQHRLFLECAWEALESAGYVDEAQGTIGVYTSANFNTYLFNVCRAPEYEEIGKHLEIVIGNDKDYLATRVSYKLNLTGPSVAVQTACSSSLVGVSLAAQALVNEQCDLALVGGVGLRARQNVGYWTESDAGLLSHDGRCRPFDAQASGFIEGNGVGVVVLKRLRDALAARDTIHATIRGFAINNDGAGKVGYTAPSVGGHARAIGEAIALAAINPATVTYVEAHGTGTPLGDPIEAEALGQYYGRAAGVRCVIGSVKSNIGHLDAAAGVASLIKAALCLEHGYLPATLHFDRPNPRARLEELGFVVASQGQPFPRPARGPRRAAVSSLGIGGTNAHVVLEEPPPAPRAELPSSGPELLVVSARSRTALAAASQRLAEHMERHPEINLGDVAYTLQVGRRTFAHRRAVVARSVAEAAQALTDPGRFFEPEAPLSRAPTVAFLFPGAGAQHVGMGAELYRREPVFREVIDECAALTQPMAGIRLLDVLYAPSPDPGAARWADMRDPAEGFVALFATELATARLFQSWGVEPACSIGHSLGEYAAAHLSGVFSLEQALRVLLLRARIFERLPEGGMIAVGLAEPEVRARLGADLALAAVNAPRSCVVSGPKEAIDALEAKLSSEGIEQQRLAVSLPAHSPLLAPHVHELRRYLEGQTLGRPAKPFLSNVTGAWITPDQARDPRYWVEHLIQPVRFAEGVRTLLEDGPRVVLHIGPGRGLSGLVQQQAPSERGHAVVPTMPGATEEADALAFAKESLGHVWRSGAPVSFRYAWARRQGVGRVPLPTYPFERERHWIDAPKAQTDGALVRARATSEQSAPAAMSAREVGLWVPSWKRALPPRRSAVDPGIWLVFLDACGVGQGIAEHLRALDRDVVAITAGQGYERRGDRAFTVRPESAPDLEALLRALRSDGRHPGRVVHTAAVTVGEAAGLRGFHEELGRGYEGLRALARALAADGDARPLRIGVLSNGLARVTSAEPLTPGKSAVLGVAKVLPHELPHVDCVHIDVELEADGRTSPSLSRALVAELSAEASGIHVPSIAYRRGARWVQCFEEVDAARAAAEPIPLRPRATYLITGGFGGIGGAVAASLARRMTGVRLALLGRTADPPRAAWEAIARRDEAARRRLQAVLDLERLGAEVLSITADVADEARMREVVADLRARFGPIRGVVHAAGVTGGGLLQLDRDPSREDNLRPKAEGCLILDSLLASDELDFMCLCSSLSSFTGAVGQTDNVAANALLDAIANARVTASERPKVVSIHWDYWLGVGMLERLREQHLAITGAEISGGLTPEQGASWFERALDLRAPEVIVSTQDFPSLLRRTTEERARTLAVFESASLRRRAGSRPGLRVPYLAPRSDLERCLVEVWQDALGIDPIGIRDGFHDLGGDSLTAMPLVSRLRETFQVKLPIVKFFAAATIEELAEVIAAAEEAPGRAARIAAAIQAIKRMSPEQVKAALRQAEPS